MLRATVGVVALLFAAGHAGAAEKELHVVATHVGHALPRGKSQPGTASVVVDRPGKEVVLVVNAYNPVTWEVTATPKTTLTKVLALGYHRQSVTAPKGVGVQELTYDGKKAGESVGYIYGEYQIDSVGFRPFVRKLFDHTGLEIVSFQGVHQFDPEKPFVVDAVQKEERLSSDFPKLPPAAQIPKLKFDATRIVYTERHSETSGYGEFTQAGPTTDRFVALPKRIRQVTYDAKNKQHYGIDNHELFTLDVALGTSTKVARPEDNRFGSLRAVTYDAKRARVVTAGRNGLFEYTPKNAQWTALVKERWPMYAGLVWQAKTDTLYAFGADRDPKRGAEPVITLFELGADGTVVNKTALGSPLFPSILGDHGYDGHAELLDLGAELALLVHCENRDTGTGERGRPETFLYVIEPKTGKTKLAWKELRDLPLRERP